MGTLAFSAGGLEFFNAEGVVNRDGLDKDTPIITLSDPFECGILHAEQLTENGLRLITLDLSKVSESIDAKHTIIPVMIEGNNAAGIRADRRYMAIWPEDASAERMLSSTLIAFEEDALLYSGREWETVPVAMLDMDGKLITGDSTWKIIFDDDGNEVERLTFKDAGIDSFGPPVYAFRPKGGEGHVRMADVMQGLSLVRFGITFVKPTEQATPTKDDAVTIRGGAVVSQWLRAATRRIRPKSVTLKDSRGDVVTRISALEDALSLKPSNRKTLTLLDREATRMSMAGEYRHDGKTVCRVNLSVADTAELYGITEASARKRLRRDFKDIANEALTVERKSGKRGWVTIPVAGGAFGIRGDVATFTFSPDIMQLVLNPTAPQVDFPPELYATNDQQYPAAFQIGSKLYSYDNQNFGKPNQDRMRLETLLNAAKEIPSAAELDKGRRSKTERIMGPFEAAMDHLKDTGVLTDWDYCHENGEPLTDDEQKTILTEHELGYPAPWEMAKDLLVTWELGKRYPLREAARQESRDKRLEAAKAAAAKKEKEEKARQRRIRQKEEKIIAEAKAEETLAGGI